MNDRRRAEQQAAFARAVLDALPAQVAVLDDRGTVVAVNEAWRRFAEDSGRTARCLPGVNFLDVCERVTGEAAREATRVAEGVRAVLDGRAPSFAEDITCETPTGLLWFDQRVVPLPDHWRGAVLSYTDVTERKALEREAAHRASHDPLTGLPNRRLLLDRLEHALAARHGRTDTVGVLSVDLDRFHEVNDRHGHAAGDAVLIEVGRRLAATVRAGDTVARLAADEYVVICERVRDEHQPTVLAERIRRVLERPVDALGHEVRIDASIGICMRTSGSGDAADAVRAADRAMRAAKQLGGGRTVAYDPDQHDGATARVQREEALKEAAAEERLTLHYQPVVDLTTGRPVGVEALLRWCQPDGSLLPAERFIDLAESTGVLRETAGWALQLACGDVAATGAPVAVHVNLAAQQLDDRLPERVQAALEASGLPADRLVLELTESSVMNDPAAVRRLLRDLRAAGVRIALDDFGTGYSSLALLSRLPVDLVKVDRSFINRLGDGADDARVVEAVLRLAAALDLAVVAEGVATRRQRDTLLDLGCATGQGYLFAPAMPAGAMAALVTGGDTARAGVTAGDAGPPGGPGPP